MSVAPAPAGRVYTFGKNATPAVVLKTYRELYEFATRRPALWARCHPSQAEIFESLWPGAVVADPRIQRGNVMLGVED